MKDFKLYLAIATVGIVWGTTFLGIKIGVSTIPAWFVAGFRQLLAAIIVLIYLLFKNDLKWIGWKNFRTQAILATLMLVGANGLTTVAEQQLSSSLTSLISSLTPVFIFIGTLIIGLQKFSFKSLTGLLMGFSGVLFIFWDGLKDLANPDYRLGILALFVGIISWAIATIYTKKLNLTGGNLVLNLFYQFAFAGVAQLILAFSTSDFNYNSWSNDSILAIIYLGIFGSVITFFAYHYLLKNLLATQVSMLSYVNTIIAIVLGWLILDEAITTKFIIAACLIISGVFIMNYKPSMFLKNKKA